MTPAAAETAAIARWFKLGQRTESIVLKGGWTEPRPKPCLLCGGRYRGRPVKRKGVLLGACPGAHATHRKLASS